MKGYLTTTEAAEFLGVTKASVYNALRGGKLKGIKSAGQWLIEKKSLAQFFLSGEPCFSHSSVAIKAEPAEPRKSAAATMPDTYSLMEYVQKGIMIYAVTEGAISRNPYRAWRRNSGEKGYLAARKEAVVRSRDELLCAIAHGTKAFAFCPAESGMVCVRVRKDAMPLLKSSVAQKYPSLLKKLRECTEVGAPDGEVDFYFYHEGYWREHSKWKELGVEAINTRLETRHAEGARLAVCAGSIMRGGLWVFDEQLSSCCELPQSLQSLLKSPPGKQAAAERVF